MTWPLRFLASGVWSNVASAPGFGEVSTETRLPFFPLRTPLTRALRGHRRVQKSREVHFLLREFFLSILSTALTEILIFIYKILMAFVLDRRVPKTRGRTFR